MKRLLILLVFLPQAALGQGIVWRPPTAKGKPLVSIPFTVPGCYASGTGGVSITRATVGTYIDGAGAVQTCSAGQYRVAPQGLLVEQARTNYVLNSTTHPKASQATGTLPTGVFTARHAGAGTMTLVAGTATVTGLSCSAVSAGTLCTGNVTVTGTLTITTTSGTTRAQVEMGDFASSWIDSGGAATTRNADVVSLTTVVPDLYWCVAATFQPELGRSWAYTGSNLGLVNLGGGGGKSQRWLMSGGSFQAQTRSGDVEQWTVGSVLAGMGTGTHRLMLCARTLPLLQYVDGNLYAGSRTITGTGYTGGQSTWYLGNSSGGGDEFTGFIQNFKVCRDAADCK